MNDIVDRAQELRPKELRDHRALMREGQTFRRVNIEIQEWIILTEQHQRIVDFTVTSQPCALLLNPDFASEGVAGLRKFEALWSKYQHVGVAPDCPVIPLVQSAAKLMQPDDVAGHDGLAMAKVVKIGRQAVKYFITDKPVFKATIGRPALYGLNADRQPVSRQR